MAQFNRPHHFLLVVGSNHVSISCIVSEIFNVE